MAKGSIAKQQILSKIAEALGDSYIGDIGGKAYAWGEENGEKVQIAISLTCPKTPVNLDKVKELDDGIDFTQPDAESISTIGVKIEITQEERDRIYKLLEKLGQN